MGLIRDWLRGALPLHLRQSVAQGVRRVKDARRRILWASDYNTDVSDLIVHAEITQPIMPGVMFENKLANIKLSASRVNGAAIKPRQTWSFWRYAQRPSLATGYVAGRNLVNGKLILQAGGGLCQLSSLIYHLGLLAGLRIEERHAHSIDIYQEHERFTPLGADATVVWGYKDLRMSNPHATEIVFECWVHDNRLTGRVCTHAPMPKSEVVFVKEQVDTNRALIRTMVNGELHNETAYMQRQGMGLS